MLALPSYLKTLMGKARLLKYLYNVLALLILILSGVLIFFVDSASHQNETGKPDLQINSALMDSLAYYEDLAFHRALNVVLKKDSGISSLFDGVIENYFVSMENLLRDFSDGDVSEETRLFLQNAESYQQQFREKIFALLLEQQFSDDKSAVSRYVEKLSGIHFEHKAAMRTLRENYLAKLSELETKSADTFRLLSIILIVIGVLTLLLFIITGLLLRRILIANQQQNILLVNEKLKLKNIQRELIEAKSDLLETERYKSVFSTNISSEFRIKMTEILECSEQLVNDTDSKTAETGQSIRHSASSLVQKFNHNLRVWQISSNYRKITYAMQDVIEIVKEVKIKHEDFARSKQLQFSLITDYREVNLDTDREMLSLVIENLVHNAINYTSSGSVELGVKTAKSLRGGIEVILSVRDTGMGISPSVLSSIFDNVPNKNADDDNLIFGLQLSKKLVEYLGGKFLIKSIPDFGSLFEVRFGVSPEGVIPDNKPVTHLEPEITLLLEPLNNRKLRILYVEDESLIGDFVSKIIAPIASIDIAVDSKTALQLALRKKYDMIFMDINLGPDSLDGMSVIREIREYEYYKHTPVICITAFDQPGDKAAFLEFGFSQYLPKPFTAPQLFAEIEKAIEVIKRHEQEMKMESAFLRISAGTE
ncbi:MAG: hybrid sensor histidine kinase/response regulator [Ignavibacteriaceae bacterium]|nr:hybrid sensor histidine kinase/response regulator [Ignavibacteriaceae bacterium]